MVMAKETIIELYKKALEDGNPARQIKSLAKVNNVKATVIKNILIEAGLEVPERIPTGPMKGMSDQKEAPEPSKKKTTIEAADPVPGEAGYQPKAAVINEDFETAVDDMTNKRVVKEMIQFGMDALDIKISEYEAELEEIKGKITELKEKKRSTTEYMKRSI